jgi:endonuclease YncB( thermonuclease family)
MLTRALLLCLLLVHVTSSLAQLAPQTFSGKVVAIKDGDTIEVLYNGKAIRVRLAHMDCPEKGQPYGSRAKEYASDLCYSRCKLPQSSAIHYWR